MEQIGIEEARRRLGEIIDRARLAHEPTQITRTGKPAAVIVAADWYDIVIDYIGSTTFTTEAAAFYARQREAGNPVFAKLDAEILDSYVQFPAVHHAAPETTAPAAGEAASELEKDR